ncbi:Protein SCD6 [Nakaseomyces bracarensis]|uniref:Protein SCD6 n=1 Tax=Nakaseomyces bracarensis TaxID=273131 RepID=A0ABR4NUI0_9SACH
MSQYIGKTISLISVTDNRYVGLLQNIDSEKGTVTLNEVRCFGTEGRKNWGPDEVYPNPAVYQSVKFNGNDVKDLSILEVKLSEVQPVLPPAHIQQQQQQQATSSASTATAGVPTSEGYPNNEPAAPPQEQQVPAAVSGYGVYAPSKETSIPPVAPPVTATAQETVKVQHHADKHPNHPQSGNRNNDRRQSHHQNQQHQHQHQYQHQHPHKVEIPDSDFDFETNNAKFSKPDEEEEIIEEDDKQDKFYDKKSSFFDSISTSAEENTNMRWSDEKELNLDTFGQTSVRPRFHNNRGRGRGGRGGRGRGNYFNNYNNNNNRSQFDQFQVNSNTQNERPEF